MYHPGLTSPALERGTDWGTLAGGATGRLEGRVRPTLAGYRLHGRLGEGRRSVVWLATLGNDPVPVALKLARRDVASRPGAAAFFAGEYDLAAAIAHPNVVRVLEQGKAGGVGFLAMEYVDGGALADHLGQPIAPQRAIAWLRQAAAGLARLHAFGFVHRDVKPANFLLRGDGSLVLADFGLAVPAGSIEHRARAGGLFGTPRYVAPEQLQGEPAEAAADVYALGVMFHELLCGRPPFLGETLMEVVSQQLVAVAPPLPVALAALQPLLDALLAKDPVGRLPDAAALLQRLDTLEHATFPAPAGPTGKRWTP